MSGSANLQGPPTAATTKGRQLRAATQALGRELWLRMKTNAPAQSTPPGWKEIAVVAAGLAALVAVQLVLANALSLFHAHFWLDELFTYAIVADPDVPHSLQA